MNSQIYWLVPDQVLYWKLSGEVPGSEICDVSRYIEKQIRRSHSNKIHMIIDCTGMTKLDYTNQNARDAFSELAKQRWMGQVVAIIRNDWLKIQMNALSSAFGLEWKNVTSMQLAVRSLKASDRMLSNVPNRVTASLIMHPEPKMH